MGQSPFKAKKYRHIFLDRPSDTCMYQSSVHFLLHGRFINAHREELMRIVQPTLCDLYIIHDSSLRVISFCIEAKLYAQHKVNKS